MGKNLLLKEQILSHKSGPLLDRIPLPGKQIVSPGSCFPL